MPTVTIPDKICSHCGGNKWFLSYSKYKNKVYENYTCTIIRSEKRKLIDKKSRDKVKHTEDYKIKNKERVQRWYLLNTERSKNNVKKAIINNPDKYRNIQRRNRQKYKDTLNANYLKDLICSKTTLSFSDIPQELIELKRKQILLTRQIRNHESKN
jgi:hypothetical protein